MSFEEALIAEADAIHAEKVRRGRATASGRPELRWRWRPQKQTVSAYVLPRMHGLRGMATDKSGRWTWRIWQGDPHSPTGSICIARAYADNRETALWEMEMRLLEYAQRVDIGGSTIAGNAVCSASSSGSGSRAPCATM